jgi:hypothetical protein
MVSVRNPLVNRCGLLESAADHCAGDPSRVAAIAETEGQAGLQLQNKYDRLYYKIMQNLTESYEVPLRLRGETSRMACRLS